MHHNGNITFLEMFTLHRESELLRADTFVKVYQDKKQEEFISCSKFAETAKSHLQNLQGLWNHSDK